MHRTVSLCRLAFMISIAVFLGFVGSASAAMSEVEDWSEPNGYAYALTRGSYQRIGQPYYQVYHKARIFECLTGRCHFLGRNKFGGTIYSVYEYLGIGMGEPYQKEYWSPFNVVWTAHTETWAPYAFPPSPHMEYASAFLLPPGMQ